MIWIVILVIISWVAIEFSNKNRYEENGLITIYGFVSIIFVGLMLITIPLSYFCNMGVLAKMQAFVWEVRDCYEYTIEETKGLTITIPRIETDGAIDLNALIYMGLAGDVSGRIVELRDKVTEYNERVRVFEIYNNNFFMDCFYPELPEELVPINLKLGD